MQSYGDWIGKFNQLKERLLERLAADPGNQEARFFYNDIENRLKVGDGTGYKTVAWLDDIYGVSNWKRAVRLSTTPADGNQTLTGTATIDGVVVVTGDRVLIKNQTDKKQNGVYVADTTGAWIRSDDMDNIPGAEIANAMVPVTGGTVNVGTIWREINDPVVIGTDDIEFTPFILNVPTEDKFVKITATDTVEKYLQDAVNNTVVVGGPGLSNQTNIEQILLNSGANEKLSLGLNLTQYTGDTEFVGDHIQTGDITVTGQTTVENILINGDQTYGVGSTINYDNSTSTGTQNFNDTYIGNYADNSEINIAGDVNREATSTQTYVDGSTVTGEVTYVDLIQNYTGDNIINLGDGSTITNNFDGDVNNNFGATYTENNVYTDGAVINNTGNVDYNYNDYTENNVYTGNTIINNTSTPVLLGCEGSPTFGVLITSEPLSQYALVTIGADEYKVLVGTNQNLTGTDYVISAVWTGVDLTLTIVSGTPTLTSVCWYNGVLVVNNDNTITNNDGDIINNTNVTETYSDSNITYDSTTNINMEGDTNIENLTVTNLTVDAGGSFVVNGAWVKQKQDTVGATTIVLTNDPLSGEAGLFVFKQDSGLHWTETDDYTYDIPTKTITFPALTAGEKIEVRYMRGVDAATQNAIYGFKTISGVLSAGTTTVVNDVDILTASPFNVYFDATNPPAGNITGEATAGTITLTSTAAEAGGQPYTIVLFASQTQNFAQPAGPGVLFTSAPQAMDTGAYTITHNLGVTQADIEAGRYSIKQTGKDASGFGFSGYNTEVDTNGQTHKWLGTDPADSVVHHWQANELRIYKLYNGYTNVRVIIEQNR